MAESEQHCLLAVRSKTRGEVALEVGEGRQSANTALFQRNVTENSAVGGVPAGPSCRPCASGGLRVGKIASHGLKSLSHAESSLRLPSRICLDKLAADEVWPVEELPQSH